ncbi:serine:threonine protein phosphatase PP1 [Trichuris trichiura]|uniref:Serine/threonine-protein phosphatase n=1 Tax=Trichuris trichiura TaxID=36087 RepID=A0A077ZB21_TRITR|nr:serine:threonine protein phosphatase PP1 [Trichuris trichiura]
MDRQVWTKLKDKLLMQVKQKCQQPMTIPELNLICTTVQSELQKQAALIEFNGPVNICGDIHGQYSDLVRLFNMTGYPPKQRYLFLGDYVDRGPQSIECICLLFLYKIRYPQSVFLLRGNHEFDNINQVYGFNMDIMRRYGDMKVWKLFNQTFSWLPLAALVNQRILCMHGGLSPALNNLDQIRTIKRPMKMSYDSLTCDLLWADPSNEVTGWKANIRGASYMFGPDVVISTCQKLDLDLIVRAHQVVPRGYEFFANNKLVTIFSAPNYCGEFDNDGAILIVDHNATCTVKQFRRPVTKKK